MLEDNLLVENNMLDETVGTLVILLIFAPMGSNVKKLHDLLGGGKGTQISETTIRTGKIATALERTLQDALDTVPLNLFS